MGFTSFKNLVLGFIAGAIATVTVHEIICHYFYTAGMFPRQPWPMTPSALTGVPQAFSDTFWGGIWGVIFAALLGNKPNGSMTLNGAVMGMILPAIFGVFLLVPLITGRFPPFFGGDLNMLWPVLVILGGWGAATAWLYGWFTSGFRLP